MLASPGLTSVHGDLARSCKLLQMHLALNVCDGVGDAPLRIPVATELIGSLGCITTRTHGILRADPENVTEPAGTR